MITEQFLEQLQVQSPELGAQVKRWLPKLQNIANDLSRVTGESYEDCLMDAMEKMLVNVGDWKLPQVRHNKRIYEVVEDGPNITIRRYGSTETAVVAKIDCEPIQKTALGTFVYQGLLQFCADKFAKHYTERNGYRLDKENPMIEKSFLDRSKHAVVKKKVKNYAKVSGARPTKTIRREDGSEFDEIDLAEGWIESAEDRLVFQGYVNFIEKNLSEQAKLLLEFLLNENGDYQAKADLQILEAQQLGTQIPTYKNDLTSAGKYFGWNRVQLRAYWCEIVMALPSDFSTRQSTVKNSNGRYNSVVLTKEVALGILDSND